MSGLCFYFLPLELKALGSCCVGIWDPLLGLSLVLSGKIQISIHPGGDAWTRGS